MKALRRTLLAAALIAAASGPAAAAAAAKAAVAAASAAPLVIGFSQAGNDSAWRNANSASIKTAAALEGITLKFADAGDSRESQIAAMRSFIAQKVDLIAFSPVAESGWDMVLREAQAAGIPVLVAGQAVEAGGLGLYAAFIGSDFAEQGRRAGRWLAARAAAAPDAAFNIVELQGAPGSPATLARSKGFAQAIAARPRLKLLHAQGGAASRAQGRQAMAAWLKAEGRNIHVVYAHSDQLAMGAIDAIGEAGLKPGRDVLVMAIGGSRAAFEAMVAGKLNVAVECSPLIGPQLMQLARDVLAGRRVPRWVTTAESVFPADAAAGELARRRY
ncbi:LacI family transcriptional regulator [Massilia sp. Root351]|jgi:simple sugar transport system substrate-binding protein|uniref:ABC transporter substrate-binding protein n=1 Tax=Massilia sp. Root351 TaxID=1736522 RepID=UPI000709A8A1|nr:ABC transporter substrate-binding protein [Massilia sp. Root351]KQV90234.1 LacI family transcriptional regulator [Massilia sp. Root351]